MKCHLRIRITTIQMLWVSGPQNPQNFTRSREDSQPKSPPLPSPVTTVAGHACHRYQRHSLPLLTTASPANHCPQLPRPHVYLPTDAAVIYSPVAGHRSLAVAYHRFSGFLPCPSDSRKSFVANGGCWGCDSRCGGDGGQRRRLATLMAEVAVVNSGGRRQVGGWSLRLWAGGREAGGRCRRRRWADG